MIIAILIVLGLCFGSFTNALVWRLYQQSLPKKRRQASDTDLSIKKGRSMCTNCSHTLNALDLVPVLSWIGLRGKCRYCKKTISWQYPLVELFVAFLFVISYIFWPFEILGWEVLSFGVWLVCLIGFMALIIYDLRWMLLPNRIIFPMYGLALAFVSSRVLSSTSVEPITHALIGALIGGGIFYVLFQVSNGRWIGGGDVKLGFLLGILAGGPFNALLVLFLASALGSLISVPLIASGKASRNSRIPFGPFLILAAFVAVLFGSDISNWYVNNFIDI